MLEARRKRYGILVLELYPQIKRAHIACVLVSDALFAWRGLLSQHGCTSVAQATPVRWLS